MKQFKTFTDFEKEEQYLNDMGKKGFEFVKHSALGIYHFKKTNPKNVSYKVDYRFFKKQIDFDDYVSMFEDSGWRHIYGTNSSGQQYFLTLSENASRDIFSDQISKAERYTRLVRRRSEWFNCMIIAIVVTLISVKFNLSELFFLTPGLWDRQGEEFWRAFWFEFPFMLMRVLPVVFFAVGALLNGYWAVKARKAYEDFLSYKEF